MLDGMAKFVHVVLFIISSDTKYQFQIVPLYWKMLAVQDRAKIGFNQTWFRYVSKHTSIILEALFTKPHATTENYALAWVYFRDFKLSYSVCKSTRKRHSLRLTKICPKYVINSRNTLNINADQLEGGAITFTTHKDFKSNLTFMVFNLSSPQQCMEGAANRMLEYMRIDICDIQCISELMCGRYPAHMRVLPSNMSSISWSLWPMIGSYFKIFYQIVDSFYFMKFSIQFPIYIPTFNRGAKDVTWIRSLKFELLNGIRCEVFRVVTVRMGKMEIFSMNKENVRISDGPGLHCPSIELIQIKLSGNIIYTGPTYSFQASILFCSLIQNKVNNIVKFSTHLPFVQSVSMSKNSEINKLSIPSKRCMTNNRGILFCVTKITTVPTVPINITIHDMLYAGPSFYKDSCLYGGTGIYFKHKQYKFDQILLACDNISSADDQKISYPSIISEPDTREIWIASYAYNKYSSLNIIISIGTSGCTAIQHTHEFLTQTTTIKLHQRNFPDVQSDMSKSSFEASDFQITSG